MNKKINASSGTPMAKFRAHVGLTGRELSERLQIPAATLASAEYGRNGISQFVLDRIKAIFPVEADEIFADFTPMRPGQPQAHLLLDLETKAMGSLYHTLAPLDEAARTRVIHWVIERLKADKR